MRRSKMARSLRGSAPATITAVALVAASLISSSLLEPLSARADRDSETGRWGGYTSPRNFEEYCDSDRLGERRAAFLPALDAADRALAAHDLKSASKAFSNARSAAYRGDGNSDLWVKCFGQSAAGRWFESQLELKRQQSKINARGSVDESAELYVSAVDQGAQATIALVGRKAPRRAVAAIRQLEKTLKQLDRERDFGAFMLKKEDALARTCRDALRSLRKSAAQQHRKALEAEAKTFSRPLTRHELAAADSVGRVQDFAMGLTGADVLAISNRELFELDRRTKESRELLRNARTWNLEITPDRKTMPSSKRARKRGDELLARSEDSESSLELRDALYKGAQRYFKFGAFDAESAKAASSRAAIRSALRVERDRRKGFIDAAGRRLADQADSAREATEKMKKNASEKKRFNDEADAMEAELDF